MMVDDLLTFVDERARHRCLRPAATRSEITDAADSMGVVFPEPLTRLYLEADGETEWLYENDQTPSCLFCDFEFLSLEGMVRTHSHWLDVRTIELDPDYESEMESRPQEMVRESIFRPGWIPFGGSSSSAYLAIDTDPGPKGTAGQVVLFGGILTPYRLCTASDLEAFLARTAAYLSDFVARSEGPDESYLVHIENSLGVR